MKAYNETLKRNSNDKFLFISLSGSNLIFDRYYLNKSEIKKTDLFSINSVYSKFKLVERKPQKLV